MYFECLPFNQQLPLIVALSDTRDDVTKIAETDAVDELANIHSAGVLEASSIAKIPMNQPPTLEEKDNEFFKWFFGVNHTMSADDVKQNLRKMLDDGIKPIDVFNDKLASRSHSTPAQEPSINFPESAVVASTPIRPKAAGSDTSGGKHTSSYAEFKERMKKRREPRKHL